MKISIIGILVLLVALSSCAMQTPIEDRYGHSYTCYDCLGEALQVCDEHKDKNVVILEGTMYPSGTRHVEAWVYKGGKFYGRHPAFFKADPYPEGFYDCEKLRRKVKEHEWDSN